MKKTVLVFILLLAAKLALCQEPVYELGYMYHGSDMLDAGDGGMSPLKVNINKISYNFLTRKYSISGKIDYIFSAPTDTIPDGIFAIFLGSIEVVPCSLGTTWTLSSTTGKIVATKSIQTFNNGCFKFKLPKNYNKKIIFTAFAAQVVELSLDSIIHLSKSK
ncbi:MAG: hypothetical protein KJ620_02865 [Candidatus Edwardsbacteria bacterium]|nr:hypothetical protein [Candidatus Edwardsbacteria bacterium]MBU1576262.1 hypothetical protein [Candidatus Edwardsbacteria bacterium]MBU2462661.1 hypothetical protein [Candidatus Edwardsbacteria bacterium]MBU2594444.1 hypothetical protein [Candidatus Edwardsbacteria bacterium]